MASDPEELLEADRFRQRDGDVPPADLLPTKRELAEQNRKAWAEAKAGTTAYQVNEQTLSRARASCASGGGIRRRIRIETQANVLAVLDIDSGATTRDRLEAARLGAQITGLAKTTVDVNVKHVVTFKGLRRILTPADATALEGEVAARLAGASSDVGSDGQNDATDGKATG